LAYCGRSAPEGNVHLSSQFEVDTFGMNWPLCHTIAGDLYLGKYGQIANIGDLTPLQHLKHIEGSLYIRWNFFLENMHGLENLQSIGKHFAISKNQRLVSLDGLDHLRTIGDSLAIFENSALQSLNGLNPIGYYHNDLSPAQYEELLKASENSGTALD